MKIIAAILFLSLVVPLSAIILSPHPAPAPAAPKTITGSVVGFNKGDSFIVISAGRKVTVNLWGIDAPEYDQPGGKEAINNLYRLIGQNNVTITVVRYDRYGRITGKVYVAGKYLNLQMASDGFAWWDRHFAAVAKDIQTAEAQARQARRGIWQNANNVDPFEWRKKVLKQQSPPQDSRYSSQAFQPKS